MGVRITENSIKGKSKVRVSDNTEQGRSRTSNMQKNKTKTHKGRIIQGVGSQKKTTKTNRLKQADIQIAGLTDKMQENQIQHTQNTQESEDYRITGIKNNRKNIQKQRTRKEQLKSADLNTLGE